MQHLWVVLSSARVMIVNTVMIAAMKVLSPPIVTRGLKPQQFKITVAAPINTITGQS